MFKAVIPLPLLTLLVVITLLRLLLVMLLLLLEIKILGHYYSVLLVYTLLNESSYLSWYLH